MMIKYIRIILLATIYFFVHEEAHAQDEGKFITIWKTNYDNKMIEFNGIGTNYTIEWEEVGNETANNGIVVNASDHKHLTMPVYGTYRLKVSPGVGTFTGLSRIASVGFEDKLLEVAQWGDIQWEQLSEAFCDAKKMEITATDSPDLSQVTDLSGMFQNCTGSINSNGSIGNWDVSNVKNFSRMFFNATNFNQDIGSWNVGNGEKFREMFYSAENFNQDIGSWNVGKGIFFKSMFHTATVFDQDIGGWNVSSGKDFGSMFTNARAFNQDIGSWDVSKGINFEGMFHTATVFDQDIGGWNVSSGKDFGSMFTNARAFNQDIGSWDVSNGENFSYMFFSSTFNQDISGWDVSNGTKFNGMFSHASAFNQDISGWDVSNGTKFYRMFNHASAFNQDISSWDVSNAENFFFMFYDATSFDQSLGNWNIENITDMRSMLNNSGLSIKNYDATLLGWASQNVKQGVMFGAVGLYYCSSENARQYLIDEKAWTIDGDIKSNDECEFSFYRISRPDEIFVCITPATTTICSGESASLTVIITGGTPSYTLTYNGNTVTLTNTAGTAETPTASYTIDTEALNITTVFDSSTVVVGDTNGCTVSYICTATVTVIPYLDDSFTINDDEVCLGSTATLTLSGSEVGVNYQLQTVSPTIANVGSPVIGTGSVIEFTVSPTVTTQYQVVASLGSQCSTTLIDKTTVTVKAPPASIEVNNENMAVCKLPDRNLNFNEYIAYQPQLPYTVEWFEQDGTTPITGAAYNTSLLPEKNVAEFVYKVTKKICNTEVTGKGELYVKPLKEQALKDKSCEYCYADAGSINLNQVREQEAVGDWTVLTVGAESYLKRNIFDGKAAYKAGVNKTGSIATYKLKFTVTEANGCLNIGDSCVITVRVTD